MFKKQKMILEENKKVLENIKREKEEYLEIKRMLEEKCEKVNITNVFVFDRDGHYDIVELKEEKISGTTIRSKGKIVEGYNSKLINIFSKVIVYEKNTVEPIQSEEYISDRYGTYKAYLHPVTSVDKNLLKYVDNMVPIVELQRLFYKLNKIDVKVLKKDK